MTDKTRMSREDLEKNFLSHYKTKLESKVNDRVHGCSLASAMNELSPALEGDPCKDALLEVLARKGLRVDDGEDEESSSVSDFFKRDETTFLLGQGYLHECFVRHIGEGVGLKPVDNTVTLAGNLPTGTNQVEEPFNPPVYDFQVRRDYMPDIRLRDVVARRRNIRGTTFKTGIIEEPDDTSNMPVDDMADLPEVTFQNGVSDGRVIKRGHRMSLSYNFYQDGENRMSALADYQRQKAAQMENAMVSEAIQLVGNGATAMSWSATPSRKEVIRLFFRPRDIYYINTLIGNDLGIEEYLDAPIWETSAQKSRGMPGNTQFFNRIARVENVGRRDTTEVPALSESNKAVLIAFDKRTCVDYIVPRNNVISERGKKIENQTITITYSIQYALALRAEADRCRFRVVIG